MSAEAENKAPGNLLALGILGAVIVAVAGFVALAAALSVESFFAGFLFILYWTGIKHGDMAEFMPSVLGAVGGTAMAAGLHFLPQLYGVAGGIAIGVLMLAAIFCMLRGILSVLINMCFMLFLTVATIPDLSAKADFIGIGVAALLGAVYSGALFWTIGRVMQRKAAAVPDPA